jgi:hypothetical protein
MRVRAVLQAAGMAALLVAPTASFAQGGGRGGPMAGVVKAVDTGAKTITVTVRGRMGMERDLTVKTNAQTAYEIGVDPAAFTDVKVGKNVVVVGQGSPQEGVTAQQVVISDKPLAVVRGAVKSADATAKTVIITSRMGGSEQDVTVTTTDKTKLHAGTAAAKWEALTAGARVAVITEGTGRDPKVAGTHIYILPAPNN